jgi:hypothetical protein
MAFARDFLEQRFMTVVSHAAASAASDVVVAATAARLAGFAVDRFLALLPKRCVQIEFRSRLTVSNS